MRHPRKTWPSPTAISLNNSRYSFSSSWFPARSCKDLSVLPWDKWHKIMNTIPYFFHSIPETRLTTHRLNTQSWRHSAMKNVINNVESNRTCIDFFFLRPQMTILDHWQRQVSQFTCLYFNGHFPGDPQLNSFPFSSFICSRKELLR